MCNDYEQHVRWADYRKMMQALDLAIPSDQSELDLPQAGDIRINDTGPVMRAAGNQIELVPMTFALPPARQGGAPVLSFRSEGRHFANSNRHLIPASAFFQSGGRTPAISSRKVARHHDGAGRMFFRLASNAHPKAFASTVRHR
jgi:putative SOS response-associated peptidase YedK